MVRVRFKEKCLGNRYLKKTLRMKCKRGVHSVQNVFFLNHIFKENQAITLYLPMVDEEGMGESTKSVLGPQKTKKTIFSHVRFLFSFFSRTLNSFTMLDSDQNRSNWINRLSLATD